MADAREALTLAVAAFAEAEAEVRRRQAEIENAMLQRSRVLRAANFRHIVTPDLGLLFELYDALFLSGAIRLALAGRGLRFRLAPRMTRTGGTTARYRVRATGEEFFEIAIGTSVLFESFSRPDDREVKVVGLPCSSRLEALQRIFEHELVHLIENLCFGTSQCSAARFQGIAARLFGHREHTHQLITRRERAAAAGVVLGSWVEFVFEGKKYRGRVRRVTKRATVLVEDPAGLMYSDGRRYLKFYIPLAALTPIA